MRLKLRSGRQGSLARPFMLAAGITALTGCVSVGPDYETPTSEVREAWLEGSAGAGSADHEQWWTSFDDPALDALVERARSGNLNLRIASLRLLEARALLGFAVGTLYPQSVGVGASATTTELSENADPVSSLPPGLFDANFNRFGTSLDAAWELDFWGRIRRGVESADGLLAAADANEDAVLVSLTGEVAAAYMLLRTFEERLGVAERNVAAQTRTLEIAEVRYRNGLVSELDVELARSLLGNTQAVVPTLEAGIRQTRYALALLIGSPPDDLTGLLGERGTIPDAPEAIALGAPADLLRRRPDIRRAEMLAAAQSARIGLAAGARYPSFRLLGTIGYGAEQSGDLFESDSVLNFGAFSIDWNPFAFGRIQNAVRLEDARFQQAVTAYRQTVLNAAREVESDLAAWEGARGRVAALEESVEASRRAVEIALVQYRDGVVSYALVLDAQRLLLLNEDQLAAARGSVAGSLVATYKSLGGGWQGAATTLPASVRGEMEERTDWGELLEADAEGPRPASERGKWRAPVL